MSLSYYAENEAPRDFRVSCTESEGHGPYKKCLLCYTVKKNFYCPDCIRAGNFVHSSMPYSDRFSEKQAKLMRLKVNRKHIIDRCEKLLSGKIKKDTLLTETKQSRDKLDIIRLAIEQRRNNIEERKGQLKELIQCNEELKQRLPRYQKRVASLGKHVDVQRDELQKKATLYHDQADELAALRRSRIRQFIKYIFPIYISYDSSDSIEDLEFLGENDDEEPPKSSQLHIVAPWINADGDYSEIYAALKQQKSESMSAEPLGGACGAARGCAALALLAQLAALLAWTLHVRPPTPLRLTDYCNWRVSESGVSWRVRRLSACLRALCARAGVPPGPMSPGIGPQGLVPCGTSVPASLAPAHYLVMAACSDDPEMGRVEVSPVSMSLCVCACAEEADDEPEPPEHLSWPSAESQEASSPPAMASSVLASAAASLASMWRGWNK